MTRRQRGSRLPRTRSMLLPLPLGVARQLSLENHLALVTLRTGSGTIDAMMALLRVLYMTYFMVGEQAGESELPLFLEAEHVLGHSIQTWQEGDGWSIAAAHLGAIERLVLRYDGMIGSVARHRYADAWDRLRSFARSPGQSPLPGSRLHDVWQPLPGTDA